MIDFLVDFFTAAPPVELLLIFSVKIIEIALATLRTILVSKGYRKEAAIIAGVVSLLWVFVVSRVLLGLADAPVKALVFCIGFSVGVFLGSYIEGFIAMGRVLIQVIVSRDSSETLISSLRARRFAVTTMEGRGRDSEKQVLMIFANRRGREEIITVINNIDKKAMIITNDISSLKGGTIAAVNWLHK